MDIQKAILFIADYLIEDCQIVKNLYDRNLTDSLHKKQLNKYLEKFYAESFHIFLESRFSGRNFRSDWQDEELDEAYNEIIADKCFFVEKRKGIKWGYGVETKKDIAFFCYMGGGTSITKNKYGSIKVLGIVNDKLKIVTEIARDIDSFHKTGIVTWKTIKEDPMTEMGHCIEDGGWGKVVDLIKIESPKGFQPHVDHYSNINL